MSSALNLTELCLQIFKGVEQTTTLFVVPLFLMRVLYGQMFGDGHEVTGAIKGVFLYFVLCLAFTPILKIILEIPSTFMNENILPGISNSVDKIKEDSEFSIPALLMKSTPEITFLIIESISAVIFWVAWALQAIICIFLTGIAPIVFLLSCVVGIGISNRLFFGLLVMTSTWPLAWFGFDTLMQHLFKVVAHPFGQLCIEFVILIFKVVVPIFSAYLSLNSGPGRLMMSGASRLMGARKKNVQGQSNTQEGDNKKTSDEKSNEIKNGNGLRSNQAAQQENSSLRTGESGDEKNSTSDRLTESSNQDSVSSRTESNSTSDSLQSSLHNTSISNSDATSNSSLANQKSSTENNSLINQKSTANSSSQSDSLNSQSTSRVSSTPSAAKQSLRLEEPNNSSSQLFNDNAFQRETHGFSNHNTREHSPVNHDFNLEDLLITKKPEQSRTNGKDLI